MYWHSGRMFHIQSRQFFGPSLTVYPTLVLAASLPPHYFIIILLSVFTVTQHCENQHAL